MEFITPGKAFVPDINRIYGSVTIDMINVRNIRNENQSSRLFRTRIVMLFAAMSFPLPIRPDPGDPPSWRIAGFPGRGTGIPAGEVFTIRASGHQPNRS